MITPVRIQRKRTRGFNLQAESRAVNGLPCVYVGRGSEFGNSFVVGRDGTPGECISKYAREKIPYQHRGPTSNLESLYLSEAFLQSLERLRGKNLACWCAVVDGDGKPVPCHADLLLAWVNGRPA